MEVSANGVHPLSQGDGDRGRIDDRCGPGLSLQSLSRSELGTVDSPSTSYLSNGTVTEAMADGSDSLVAVIVTVAVSAAPSPAVA